MTGRDEDMDGGEAEGLTRVRLVDRVAAQVPATPREDVVLAVRVILETMGEALAQARVIEIRGFGTFCLHYYRPILGRNPRSGEPLALEGRYVPHFRPGRLLRARLDKRRAASRG